MSGPKDRTIKDNKKIKLISSAYGNNNKYIYKTDDYNLEHFLNLDSYEYLGAINFYNSLVEIDKCNFKFINSEDALNVISSKFTIKDSFFQENSSDAIDIDFSDGQIENIKLKIIGNDGIDISGSKVNLQKIDLSNIGDKSLSVGSLLM